MCWKTKCFLWLEITRTFLLTLYFVNFPSPFSSDDTSWVFLDNRIFGKGTQKKKPQTVVSSGIFMKSINVWNYDFFFKPKPECSAINIKKDNCSENQNNLSNRVLIKTRENALKKHFVSCTVYYMFLFLLHSFS